MRTVSFLKFYVVAVSVLYILYSLVSLTGMQRVILTLAFTAVSPGAFREVLKIRGVRRGDAVLVSRSMSFFMQKVPGRALENGRRGDAIRIKYGFERAVGEIMGYGGLFFPAEVNILNYGDMVEVEE